MGVKVFKLKKSGDTVFGSRLTVAHDDEGWDHYADAWEVVGPDGSLLGRRVLLHPHVNEQPFTRTADINVPKSVTEVTVRARDKSHGTGGHRDGRPGASQPVGNPKGIIAEQMAVD